MYDCNDDALKHSCNKNDDDEGCFVNVDHGAEELQLYQTVLFWHQWKQKSGLYLEKKQSFCKTKRPYKNLVYLCFL